MALRVSGRSSHSVATWPSSSMERTSEVKESMAVPEAMVMAPSVGRASPTGAARRRRTGAGRADAGPDG